MINTTKASDIFSNISRNIIKEQREIDEAIKFNSSLSESKLRKKERDTICQEILNPQISLTNINNKYQLCKCSTAKKLSNTISPVILDIIKDIKQIIK